MNSTQQWMNESNNQRGVNDTFSLSTVRCCKKRISGFKIGLLCNVASLPFAYMCSVGDLFCPGTRWFMDALATMLPPLLTFSWFSHRLFNFGRRNPLPRRQVQFPSTQSRSSPGQVQVKSKSSLWRIQFVFKSWTVVAQKLILVSDILFNRTPLPGSIIWLVEVQFQSSKSKILHNFSEHTSQSLDLILDLDYKLLFNHFISNKLLNINMK